MTQQDYQASMLAELQKVAEKLGTSTLVHKDWANTGLLIAGTPFTQYATLRYDFQPRRVTILFNGASLGPGEDAYYFDITDTAQANVMLERWRTLIVEGQTK